MRRVLALVCLVTPARAVYGVYYSTGLVFLILINFNYARIQFFLLPDQALRPYSLPSSPRRKLKNPRYEKMTHIARTVHLEQFHQCMKNQKVVAQPTTSIYKTKLRGGRQAWFRAITEKEKNNPDRDDWFGNVRFVVNSDTILHKKVNVFFVDTKNFKKSSATRILLSASESYGQLNKLDLDSLDEGDALFRKNGEIFFAVSQSMHGQYDCCHSLHVLIDATTICMSSLFCFCRVIAVNHVKANRKCGDGSYGQRQCLIFNGEGQICPSAVSRENTQRCIDNHYGAYPGYPNECDREGFVKLLYRNINTERSVEVYNRVIDEQDTKGTTDNNKGWQTVIGRRKSGFETEMASALARKQLTLLSAMRGDKNRLGGKVANLIFFLCNYCL